MNTPSSKPAVDNPAGHNHFAITMILFCLAALGADKVLNATNLLGTIAGWVSLFCGGVGFIAGITTYLLSRGGSEIDTNESGETNHDDEAIELLAKEPGVFHR